MPKPEHLSLAMRSSTYTAFIKVEIGLHLDVHHYWHKKGHSSTSSRQLNMTSS